ncbi:MAG: tetratricopeptide repeat protein [Gammaproteobacteria bacterium]|nr:tetratricopeptide repeat protein [Gammaproteobacteria bacterium]
MPRHVVLIALIGVLAGAGCATKGDIRVLQEEVGALADRQARDLADFETLVRAGQDTLSGQTGLYLELRREVLQRLDELLQQILILIEVEGQSQRAMASLRDQVEMMQRAPVVVQDSGDVGLPLEDVEGPDAHFEAALVMYNRGSNVTARRGFDEFLANYPNHELAGDATFFLSDLDLQEERLEDAIEGFMRVPMMYPDSPRVPEALYRAALLHDELGDTEEARNLLERVISGFPDSDVAEDAQQKLQEIPQGGSGEAQVTGRLR